MYVYNIHISITHNNHTHTHTHTTTHQDDAHADKIWGLAVSGDGSSLVTGSSDATVRIWDDVTVEVIEQQVGVVMSCGGCCGWAKSLLALVC